MTTKTQCCGQCGPGPGGHGLLAPAPLAHLSCSRDVHTDTLVSLSDLMLCVDNQIVITTQLRRKQNVVRIRLQAACH